MGNACNKKFSDKIKISREYNENEGKITINFKISNKKN